MVLVVVVSNGGGGGGDGGGGTTLSRLPCFGGFRFSLCSLSLYYWKSSKYQQIKEKKRKKKDISLSLSLYIPPSSSLFPGASDSHGTFMHSDRPNLVVLGPRQESFARTLIDHENHLGGDLSTQKDGFFHPRRRISRCEVGTGAAAGAGSGREVWASVMLCCCCCCCCWWRYGWWWWW